MVEELREEIKLSMPGKLVLYLSCRTTLMHDGSQHGRLTSMHSYKDSYRQWLVKLRYVLVYQPSYIAFCRCLC